MVHTGSHKKSMAHPWRRTRRSQNCSGKQLGRELLVIEQVFKMPAQRSRLRRVKQRVMDTFDPAKFKYLNSHCFYACLYFTLTRTIPGRKDIRDLRKLLAWAWKQDPEALEEQASLEEVDGKTYLRSFVYNGWGGLPEIRRMAMMLGSLNVCIWSQRGDLLWKGPGASCTADHWCYTGSHYYIAKGQPDDQPQAVLNGPPALCPWRHVGA